MLIILAELMADCHLLTIAQQSISYLATANQDRAYVWSAQAYDLAGLLVQLQELQGRMR
jgi:hypothetical protein